MAFVDRKPLMTVVAQKIKLKRKFPPVLGVGAYLKSALCLIQGDEAWISRENGALDNVERCRIFRRTAEALIGEAREKPAVVAHDYHPDFYCTRWAKESGLRTFAVQHHHAHGAAVMAERGLEEPVLGLALDGFGLGENNEAWGGELLRIDARGYARVGHLRPLAQPGGDAAARQPWRMGAAALFAMGRGGEIAARYAGFEGAKHLFAMMEHGLNAPRTSSAGRLFDAACGLLNVKLLAAFEGEAPTELERLARTAPAPESLKDGWRIEKKDGVFVLDMVPFLERLVGMEAASGAALFHDAFIRALVEWVCCAAKKEGISKIALSGGCFFNKILRAGAIEGMMARGLEPMASERLSAGDVCIALGQAYAAALATEKEG